MPKVKVGDINMYYKIHGEGEPLVLITGLSGDTTGWALQIPMFSKKYQVICFDNRGGGRTDAPDVPYSYEMMADDTAGLLNTLGIEKAHILGASMGGAIAQEFAIKYPQRVRGLILSTTWAGQSNFLGGNVLKTWDRMAQEGVSPETLIREQLSWLCTDKFFENEKQVNLTVKMVLSNPHPQPAHALARLVAAAWEFDMRDRLGQITAPTLVLVGKEDILVPVKFSEELARGIPNAELVVLEGGGHLFMVEISDKFNQAVLDFLAKVEQG